MARSFATCCMEPLEDRQLLSTTALGYAVARFPTITGAGQTIAILDSGVEYWRPEFGQSVIDGWNFVNNNSDLSDPFGHGTAVTSIISARRFVYAGRRYQGLAQGANIVMLKVVDDQGNTTDGRIRAALQWVLDHRTEYNITAVNMSFGDGLYTQKTTRPAYSDQLAELAHDNVFIAAASGNDGATNAIEYPAADPNVVAVGAISRTRVISPMTSRGPALQLLAPGTNVTVLTNDPNLPYVKLTGTSFASPYAVAAAVLLRQLHPQMTRGQVIDRLVSSGLLVRDRASGLTFRQINLAGALYAEKRQMILDARAAARAAALAARTQAASSAVASPTPSVLGTTDSSLASLFNTTKPIAA